MRKAVFYLLALLFIIEAQSQNVGIGTAVPVAKLQINHKNTGSSPSLRLFDSAAGSGSSIVFSKEGQTNSFSIVSTIGLLAAANTLDLRTTFNSAMIIKGDGTVGIGTATPQARLQIGHTSTGASPTLNLFDNTGGAGSILQFSKQGFTSNMQVWSGITGNAASGNSLNIQHSGGAPVVTVMGDGKVGINEENPANALDVGGDINTTGTIRVNGVDGLAGQALMKNNSGQLSWQFPEAFKNIQSFNIIVPTTWTVPAGVTRIKIELWGGGGGGGGVTSGHSGAYVMALLSVTPGDVWNVLVGQGGSGGDPAGNPGDTTSFTRGGISINACGGRQSNTIFCADYVVTGTSNYIGLKGHTGCAAKYSYEEISNSFFIFVQDADGADAPLMPHTGGGSGWGRTNGDGSNPTGAQGGSGSAPGGGGGLRYGSGGNGLLVISW